MLSRMILVGLVAVLGVSLPSRSESGGWLTSAHEWVIARLAEWDTYTPREDVFIVGETLDSSTGKATQAETCTNTTTSVPFEPIPLGDLDIALADELYRMAEGLDIPATNIPIAESPTDFVAVPPSDSIELKLVMEVCRIAEGSAHATKPSPRQRLLSLTNRFRTRRSISCSRTARPCSRHRNRSRSPSLNSFPKPTQPLRSISCSRTARPCSRHRNRSRLRPGRNSSRSRHWCTLRWIPPRSGIGSSRASRFVPRRRRPRPVQTPTFEPITVPVDLESGIAYELNLASEGLEIALPEVRTLGDAPPRFPGVNPPPTPKANASTATPASGKPWSSRGNAAFAWMNVLTGMTPATSTLQ